MSLFKPVAEANLRHGIETFLESKGCDFVISEVRSDWGIADYVGVFVNGKKIRGQNHSHVSLDNRYYHQLLARVNGKKSRSSLYAEFGVSPSTLDPYIDTLIKLGYLVETVCGDSAFVEKKRLFVPCTSRMYAVEAKIKDWKKGLFQASRYTIFANRTYLAVPFKIATRLKKKHSPKFSRVGLIGVADGQAHELINAREQEPIGQYLNIVSERIRCEAGVSTDGHR